MYTNNDKSGERRFKFRAKNLLSPTKERKLFSRGGEICWKDRIHVPHPPIDSILIVFHAFERAPSRKIELYELATSFYERVFASRSGCTSSNDRRGRALTRSKVDFTSTEEEEETVSFGKSFFADGRTNGDEIWTWKIDFPRR